MAIPGYMRLSFKVLLTLHTLLELSMPVLSILIASPGSGDVAFLHLQALKTGEKVQHTGHRNILADSHLPLAVSIEDIAPSPSPPIL